MKGDSSTCSVGSTLYVGWSNADTPDATTITDRPTANRTSSTSPTAGGTRSPTSSNAAKVKNDDSSSREKSMNATTTTSNASVSSRSLASTKSGSAAMKNYAAAGTSSVMFQGLLREKEHTESTSSNRTLGGGFMRRNQSADRIATRKHHINVDTSHSGKRLSDLTTTSNADDDDEKSINLEDANTDAQGEETAFGSLGNLYQTNGGSSSRSIFNNFISRAVKSSSNLAAVTEGLAEEIGSRHKSNYFRSRASVKVRRASDFLFSSHHRQGVHVVDDDVIEEEDSNYDALE